MRSARCTSIICSSITSKSHFFWYVVHKSEIFADPHLQVSALIDPNVGPAVLEGLSPALREKAVAELRDLISLRSNPPMTVSREISSSIPAFLRPAVRRLSNTSTSTDDLDALMIDICRAKQIEAERGGVASGVSTRNAAALALAADPDADPDDRVPAAVVDNVNLSNIIVDPIKFYTDGAGAKYRQAAAVALEMMAMASGEAACERMFSKAGYFDADRRDFTPHTLTMLTMCKYYPDIK
jgi:hypothetical protein